MKTVATTAATGATTGATADRNPTRLGRPASRAAPLTRSLASCPFPPRPKTARPVIKRLQHSYIAAALDAGVRRRDVQIAAWHADPRTATRSDRARGNLDWPANYIVAAFIAGAA